MTGPDLSAIAVGAVLIAQAVETASPPWLSASIALSTGGILVWYLWYTTAVVQPRSQQHVENIVKEFSAEQKESRKCFQESLSDTCKEITTTFKEEIRGIPCKQGRPGESGIIR